MSDIYMPVHVAEAGMALYIAYALGLEPSVTDVLVWLSWMTQHGPDVSKDVERVMTKYMIREPEWYAAAFSRRSTNRARRGIHTGDQ